MSSDTKKNWFYFSLGVFISLVVSSIGVWLYDAGYPGFAILRQVLFWVGIAFLVLAFLLKPIQEDEEEKKEDKKESYAKKEVKEEKEEKAEKKEKEESKKEDKPSEEKKE